MFGPMVGLGVAVTWLAFLITAAREAFRPVVAGGAASETRA